MSDQIPDFEADERPVSANPLDRFVLELDGYEGPLDVLLALARDQKVDLTKISILQLAEQYLVFIQRAKELRLDLAAEYLVMAAWLAYLKSKLILPQTKTDDEPSGAEMAAALQFQLRRIEALREALGRLLGRPQLGTHFHARGAAEALPVSTSVVYKVTLFDLMKAYAEQKQRNIRQVLEIRASEQLFSVEEVVRRLEGLLGKMPDWTVLSSFLPVGLQGGLQRRSALAPTFAASLELAKSGRAVLRQEAEFGPIYIKTTPANDERP